MCLGVAAFQTWTAASALLDARSRAEQVEDEVTAGEYDAANRTLALLQQDTHRAESATDGMLWDLGRHLPLIGDNVQAVQTLSSVLDTATRENAPVALELSRAVDEGTFRPVGGRIDLAAIEALTPSVTRAAASITREQARLAELEELELTFPFEDVVRELNGQLDRAASAATSVSTAFTLLPEMLGRDAPRRYLLMIQNNAEIRSTGGIPGSFAVLHADKGRVRMGLQGSAADIGIFPKPVLRPGRDALAAYGTSQATDFRDTTFNPDFPSVARMAAAMLRESRGVRVDGVLSVDPVALSLLLRGTGPVPVAGVRLNAGNAVGVLLNQTYQLLGDQAAQDDFFEASARSIFDSVMGGRGNQRLAVTGLATGAAQRRVLVWSRRPAEQRRLAGTAVAGELPGGDDPSPHVGVYLNDATGAKPEFYLDYRTAVTATSCSAEGVQDLESTVALSSTMPKDVASLSPSITGTGIFAPIGTIQFNLRFYGPVGGEITELEVDGEQVAITAGRHRNRQVAVVPIGLRPGQRMLVSARMTSGPGQTDGPVLTVTPGVTPEENGVQLTSACP